MSKSLEQLGEEYLLAAQQLDNQIKKYRELLKESYKTKSYLKTYDIKRKLVILYDQKRDAMTTAYTLKNYYESKEETVNESTGVKGIGKSA